MTQDYYVHHYPMVLHLQDMAHAVDECRESIALKDADSARRWAAWAVHDARAISKQLNGVFIDE